MKISLIKTGSGLVFCTIVLLSLGYCKKTENPIKYPKGTFPDSTIALSDINSIYDDYNMDLHQLLGNVIMVFSSNRNSAGGQFDLVQGITTFTFDQTTGAFGLGCEMSNDAFITNLLNTANTDGNDFGPYRFFSTVDGYEYLLLSSVNTEGNLDFYYLKNQPASGSILPVIHGPYPATLLNTGSDDAYISFDTNQDSAFFSSNINGNFEIYLKTRPADTEISTWLDGTYSASAKVDSLNSSSNDKCPFVYKKIMVFASDRPGGLGGYDLYYSVFKNGKWNSPVNFGPGVNSTSDEYRPVISGYPDFTNYFMVFSSNRPGGKGGFDLYFRGVDIIK
jgi:hypothetical protein